MKNFLFLFVIICVLIVAACETLPTEDLAQGDVQLKSAQKKVMNFTAHLSGVNEVPAIETNATGEAIFQLSKDGMKLSYKVIVANIEDVLQSHIHIAPAGTNGGVVAFLYPFAPPAVLIPGTSNGILAQGTITAQSLRGILVGKELSSLIDSIKVGHAYVNVHTIANPSGEIRGQIMGN